MLTAGHRPKIHSAGHLTLGLDPSQLTGVIEFVTAKLSRYDFDAIAFRGLSGALIAPIVAWKMGKSLLAVRRKIESCHSDNIVEGDYAARRYVILDDFVSSGQTVRDIIGEIREVMPRAECIGVCEYMFRHQEDLLPIKAVAERG